MTKRLTDGQVLAMAKRLAERNIVMLQLMHQELAEVGVSPEAMEREAERVLQSAQRILEANPLRFVGTSGSA